MAVLELPLGWRVIGDRLRQAAADLLDPAVVGHAVLDEIVADRPGAPLGGALVVRGSPACLQGGAGSRRASGARPGL